MWFDREPSPRLYPEFQHLELQFHHAGGQMRDNRLQVPLLEALQVIVQGQCDQGHSPPTWLLIADERALVGPNVDSLQSSRPCSRDSGIHSALHPVE